MSSANSSVGSLQSWKSKTRDSGNLSSSQTTNSLPSAASCTVGILPNSCFQVGLKENTLVFQKLLHHPNLFSRFDLMCQTPIQNCFGVHSQPVLRTICASSSTDFLASEPIMDKSRPNDGSFFLNIKLDLVRRSPGRNQLHRIETCLSNHYQSAFYNTNQNCEHDVSLRAATKNSVASARPFICARL